MRPIWDCKYAYSSRNSIYDEWLWIVMITVVQSMLKFPNWIINYWCLIYLLNNVERIYCILDVIIVKNIYCTPLLNKRWKICNVGTPFKEEISKWVVALLNIITFHLANYHLLTIRVPNSVWPEKVDDIPLINLDNWSGAPIQI